MENSARYYYDATNAKWWYFEVLSRAWITCEETGDEELPTNDTVIENNVTKECSKKLTLNKSQNSVENKKINYKSYRSHKYIDRLTELNTNDVQKEQCDGSIKKNIQKINTTSNSVNDKTEPLNDLDDSVNIPNNKVTNVLHFSKQVMKHIQNKNNIEYSEESIKKNDDDDTQYYNEIHNMENNYDDKDEYLIDKNNNTDDLNSYDDKNPLKWENENNNYDKDNTYYDEECMNYDESGEYYYENEDPYEENANSQVYENYDERANYGEYENYEEYGNDGETDIYNEKEKDKGEDDIKNEKNDEEEYIYNEKEKDKREDDIKNENNDEETNKNKMYINGENNYNKDPINIEQDDNINNDNVSDLNKSKIDNQILNDESIIQNVEYNKESNVSNSFSSNCSKDSNELSEKINSLLKYSSNNFSNNHEDSSVILENLLSRSYTRSDYLNSINMIEKKNKIEHNDSLHKSNSKTEDIIDVINSDKINDNNNSNIEDGIKTKQNSFSENSDPLYNDNEIDCIPFVRRATRKLTFKNQGGLSGCLKLVHEKKKELLSSAQNDVNDMEIKIANFKRRARELAQRYKTKNKSSNDQTKSASEKVRFEDIVFQAQKQKKELQEKGKL
ncbi:conserved Plasmodium protein, unknown function [Plasmodium yoelii]|uniref:Uncharacterized protein n=3 Tax=Plasmodium yoelii TaxID=5861 RepID=A0AAE9WVA8_PLAYO|nr:conserved Plasmodium protein, unknown function [Plasmodium yoelii]EAA18131.1 hypothetical protein [Plasmodium yoelii yoelii]WBY60847.1 hypothetical protein Py17XNL_001401109 [Plasmodium yoelii yoelii]CDU20615.1 conserved Plasmodium protein, unknown function [Plasmodium yoelii]VTZ81576.1 conserved Plasmodium protein, unknown function [Plasmodium yoelii]|eukprot:XP_726566.1 conserved Plasmodium protein, unknown function [Plasmodium yoelii]